MNIHDLRTAFENPNVKAFYMVVRNGESSLTDDAYSMVNGGGRFFDFSKHPYQGLSTRNGGKAAGASQFIPSTWAELAQRYGFEDFSPANQDLGYVGCLVKRNALEDVIAGRFDEAVAKCELEWTSLPGAAENNPSWNIEKARALYLKYGGTFATQPAAPIEDHSIPAAQPEGKPTMGALALLPLLAQFVPQIMSLIKPNSASTARDAQIAQTVLNVATQAAGIIKPGETANAAAVGAAVDAMQEDPKLAKKVQEAVVTHPDIIGVLEIGGGITAARTFGTTIQNAEKPFWYNPTFWITVMLFPMMYMIAFSTLFTTAPDTFDAETMKGLAWYQKVGFDSNTRTGLINLIVGFVFGGVIGVWFGTSYGSQRKTELAAENKPTLP